MFDDPPRLQLELQHSSEASRAARTALREIAEPAACRRLDDVLLATSELVTNAVVHTEGRVALRAWCETDRWRVEVADGGEHDPVRRPPHGTDVGGWGLHIVAAIASRWGVDHVTGGKCCWFEIGT